MKTNNHEQLTVSGLGLVGFLKICRANKWMILVSTIIISLLVASLAFLKQSTRADASFYVSSSSEVMKVLQIVNSFKSLNSTNIEITQEDIFGISALPSSTLVKQTAYFINRHLMVPATKKRFINSVFTDSQSNKNFKLDKSTAEALLDSIKIKQKDLDYFNVSIRYRGLDDKDVIDLLNQYVVFSLNDASNKLKANLLMKMKSIELAVEASVELTQRSYQFQLKQELRDLEGAYKLSLEHGYNKPVAWYSSGKLDTSSLYQSSLILLGSDLLSLNINRLKQSLQSLPCPPTCESARNSVETINKTIKTHFEKVSLIDFSIAKNASTATLLLIPSKKFIIIFSSIIGFVSSLLLVLATNYLRNRASNF